MNILSCIGAAVAAAIFAAPICAFCTSVGLSGLAALAGAALVISLIPTGGV
ncbi:MAG TPA: hypothetical protein V6D48_22895 [Oculatellaceae cyanobacterium]